MPPRFSTRQIDAFVAAAELANFTLAARRLNLTPSAVSNLISDLERSFGFALFERTTRKVALTPEGREFLPSALAVQRQISRASIAAADIGNHMVDVVRVAAPMAIAALLLPPLIADYRAVQAKTVVRIVDTGVEWLADRVQTGEADIALGPDRAVAADIAKTPIFPTEWVVWCRPDHPLALAGADVAWQDLRNTDVFAAGRDHEHSVLPQLPPDSDTAKVRPVQIVDNLSTALGIAAAGLGVTFSPDYVAPLAEALGLVKRTLIAPHVHRQVTLYRPAERAISVAATAFGNFLVERLSAARPEKQLFAR
jgi:DNA-binding transcriptional LysR family regulator